MEGKWCIHLNRVEIAEVAGECRWYKGTSWLAFGAAVDHDEQMRFEQTMPWPDADVLSFRPELGEQLRSLVTKSAARLPGRLDALMTARVEQLRGREVGDNQLGEMARQSATHPDLSVGERAVVALTEQFVIDVRGLTSGGFDLVNEFYSVEEVAAISFRLALLEGMSKIESLFADSTAGGV